MIASSTQPQRTPSVLSATRRILFVMLLTLAVLAGASITASSMVIVPNGGIVIDGAFGDWDPVLADPQNILYDNQGSSDGDTPTAARNLGRVAYTWDDTSLYFYHMTAAPVSAATNFYTFIDVNNNGLMDAADRVLDANFNSGAVWADPVRVWGYVPGNPAGDPITGDGIAQAGELSKTALYSYTKPPMTDDPSRLASSANGVRFTGGTKVYFESRIDWVALGVPAGSPLNFHFAAGNPSGGSSSDNAGPGEGGASGTGFSSLDVAPSLQVAAKTGETVSLGHTVTQNGNVSDLVQLSAFTTSGWPCVIMVGGAPATSVFLTAGQTANVSVLVDVPDGATLGSAENVYLTATSAYDPSMIDRVTDQIYPGDLTVRPDRTSGIAAGSTVHYEHTIENLTGSELVVDLDGVSRSGWTTSVTDSSDAQLSSVTIPPLDSATVVLHVTAPSDAVVGTQDTAELRAVAQGDSGLADTAYDVSTVRPPFELTPDNAVTCNSGQVLQFNHTLTNNTDAPATITLGKSVTQATWPVNFYDPTGLTVLATPTYALDPHESVQVIVRLTVPLGVGSATDIITIDAYSGAVPVARATDTATVVALATYADPALQVPSATFRLGDTVYIGESGAAGTSGYVYFAVYDKDNNKVYPAGTGFASAAIIDGSASTSFVTSESSPVGPYTVSLYNTSTGSLVTSVPFEVTYDAKIDYLGAPNATTTNELIRVGASLLNSNSISISSSLVRYTMWHDTNASGEFDAGDYYIDAAGDAQVCVDPAASITYSSTKSVAPGSTPDSWSITNADFPYAGTYNVTARWYTSQNVLIDTENAQFFSPGGPWAEYTVDKRLADGQSDTVSQGEHVVFDLVIDNFGDTALTNVPVTDTFSSGDFVIVATSPSADSISATGAIWTNAAAASKLGPIAPGTTKTITVEVIAVSDGVNTNTMTASGVVDIDGTSLPAASDSATVTVEADTTPPVVTITPSPPVADGDDGWYISTPSATLAADEPALLQYSFVSEFGPWELYADEAFPVLGQGTVTLWARGTDGSGNVSIPVWQSFEIDTVDPTTAHDAPSGTVAEITYVTLTGDDGTSGPYRTYYKLNDGEWTEYSSPVEVSAEGENSLRFYTVDVAGNAEDPQTVTFTVDIVKPAIDIDFPVSGQTYEAAVTPEITISGETSSTIYLDGIEWDGSPITGEGEHTIRVVAEDDEGNFVEESVTFTVEYPDTTPPAIPQNLTASADSDSIVVSWERVEDADLALYRLYRATSVSGPFTAIAEIPAGTVVYDDQSAQVEVTYFYRVTALDGADNESAPSNTDDARVAAAPDTTPPAVPLNLTATANSDSITVDWDAVSAPDLDGYNLYRASSPSGPFELIAQLPAGTTAYDDADIAPETMYYYRVAAVDTSANESATSNVARALVSPLVERLWGPDRLDTARNVSETTFSSAEVVIIATSQDFADALSASGLAGTYRAPLLLTAVDQLDASTKAEIKRLGASRAIIVGGPKAVSPGVEKALRDMDLSVSRFGGSNRFGTSVLIAGEIERHERALGNTFTTQVFVARGDEFPDALSVSPLAYALRAPILLTMPTGLPSAVGDYVKNESFKSQLVVGGTNAVSPAVATQLAEAGRMTSTRKGGSNRYETSALIAEHGAEKKWVTYKTIGVATGQNFPDALTGGVATGEMGGVLMVTTPETLHPDIKHQIETNKSAVFKVRLYGGPKALSENVANQIKQLLK